MKKVYQNKKHYILGIIIDYYGMVQENIGRYEKRG